MKKLLNRILRKLFKLEPAKDYCKAVQLLPTKKKEVTKARRVLAEFPTVEPEDFIKKDAFLSVPEATCSSIKGWGKYKAVHDRLTKGDWDYLWMVKITSKRKHRKGIGYFYYGRLFFKKGPSFNKIVGVTMKAYRRKFIGESL